MSTEERKNPENTNADSNEERSVSRDLGTDFTPSIQQETAPEAKQDNFLERSRKFFKEPKTYLEIITLIALIFYTSYAGQQATLTRDAVKAAREANAITAQLSRAVFEAFVVTPEPQMSRISLYIGNAGRTVANVVSVVVEMTIQRVSDDSIIQHERRESNDPVSVRPGGSINKYIEINGRWPEEATLREQAIWQELWQDIIIGKLQIQYDSGFGKIEQQSFCQVVIADERINGPGKRLGMTNQSCEDATAFVQARIKQLGQDTQ